MKNIIGRVIGLGSDILRSCRERPLATESEEQRIEDIRNEVSETIGRGGDLRTVTSLLQSCPKAAYPYAVHWLALAKAMVEGDRAEVSTLLFRFRNGSFPHAEKWLTLDAAVARDDVPEVERLLRYDVSDLYPQARAWLKAKRNR